MKSCNKSVKLHCHNSTQKYDDSITRYFPFSKREFPPKIKCCFYIIHGENSESLPDYTIFICKFKTDECFLLMKCF